MNVRGSWRYRARDVLERRRGAAMLIVLMVLLMTTATATFAIHSTTVEIRSAGYSRQAMQTAYVAEGGLYASLAQVDVMGGQAAVETYNRTVIPSGVARLPGESAIDRESHSLTIAMEDFAASAGGVRANSPPLELDMVRTPSLGPRGAYVPNFVVDGRDMYRTTIPRAGQEMSGRSAMHHVVFNMTSRGTMAPPGDYRADTDPRDYHETVVNARAMAVVGPIPGS